VAVCGRKSAAGFDAACLLRTLERGEEKMRSLIGVGVLAATISLIMLLRPRGGRERFIVRFPGAWIPVGLLLTVSFGTGVALLVTGIGILK
jgi:hypothetical protein